MNKPFAVLALALSLTSLGMAADSYAVIPPTIGSEMKDGKKLDKVWFAPSIEKGLKVRKTEVAWTADDRNSSLEQELTKQLATIQVKDGAYTLKLTVVDTSKKKFTGFGYILGRVTVEGVITDAGGKVVAAFQNKSKINEGMGGFDYPATVDTIMNGIQKDLL